MSRMIERLNHWWKSESTRHFLWLPVCFAAGIALYFYLPSEPNPKILPLMTLGLVSLTRAWRKHALPLMLALSLMALGAAYAQIRAYAHHPAPLHESLSPRLMLGVVRDIERTERGVRLLMDHLTIDDLPADKTPARVRLSVKFKKDATFELPPIGAAIAIRAGLMPPVGPVLPGGFDFARFFYFRDVDMVGYGLPPWEMVGTNSMPTPYERFESWRTGLTHRIVTTLGAEAGGIVAGLITGDARAISEADFQSLRASNLYHIIAISGEHMVIISGVIFISLRLLLLLLPARWALRPQGKSIAAAITLLLVTVYLFVTGLPPSATRAYVMIVLVLLAVLLRRQVDPMRSLAITALILLLYDPALLLDPGFQLSFAATLALIALIEARVMAPPPALERTWLHRTVRMVVTMLLVSVVAEAATALLAISMFNNFSLYGVFANSIATPLVSLFLMPMVAVFFILLPFGCEGIALALLKHGAMALLALSRFVASLPHAQFFVPSPPGFGMALFALGLLWVCLWRHRVRWLGLLPAVLGVATISLITLPDVLMTGNLKQIAFRAPNGYVLARGRADAMVPEMWANGLGYKELEPADAPHWRCDKLGCIANVKGQKIAFPSDLAASLEDCAKVAVIASARVPVACDHAHILSGPVLATSGVSALWVSENGTIRRATSADWQGNRPWSMGGEEDGEE